MKKYMERREYHFALGGKGKERKNMIWVEV